MERQHSGFWRYNGASKLTPLNILVLGSSAWRHATTAKNSNRQGLEGGDFFARFLQKNTTRPLPVGKPILRVRVN